MKKKISALLILLLIVLAPALFTACDVGLYRLAVKYGTLANTCVVGDTIDYSNLVVVVEYLNGEKEEVPPSEIQYTPISTETAGEKTLVITYKNKTLNYIINCYENIDQAYEIVGFEKPSFVVGYQNNTAVKTNKETEFTVLDDGYYVGDDNAFKFLPEITVIRSGEDFILKRCHS